MIASIARPMRRCFLIFIVPAPSVLEHHEARGLLDDLHGDDSLAALLKDAGDVGEGSVEKSEASGLHVAGPGLELYHRVGSDLEALEVPPPPFVFPFGGWCAMLNVLKFLIYPYYSRKLSTCQ